MSRRLALISTVVVLAVVAFVAGVVVRSWPHATLEIIREKSPIAWLSVALLVGSAAVAVAAGIAGRGPPAFFVLAAALGVAALDERFMGHEHLKALILREVFDYHRATMGHWGDAPMALVPLIGGGLLWSLRREIVGWPCRAALAGAFAAGVVAIALDIATVHPVAQLVEELLEVAAETLFLLALLAVVDRKLRSSARAT